MTSTFARLGETERETLRRLEHLLQAAWEEVQLDPQYYNQPKALALWRKVQTCFLMGEKYYDVARRIIEYITHEHLPIEY